MKKRLAALLAALCLLTALTGCAASTHSQRPSWEQADRQTIDWLRSVRS